VIWKRLQVLIATPFLLAGLAEGQNQPKPNAPHPGTTVVSSKKYTITGAVKRPGSYSLDWQTTVFDAFNQAGGFRDAFASVAYNKDIRIVRGTQTLHFNYDDFIRGRNRDQNKAIELEDRDLVEVGPASPTN
jgi:protein involved in polysaccharide export with SLBB domain